MAKTHDAGVYRLIVLCFAWLLAHSPILVFSASSPFFSGLRDNKVLLHPSSLPRISFPLLIFPFRSFLSRKTLQPNKKQTYLYSCTVSSLLNSSHSQTLVPFLNSYLVAL
ncbi:MAG: hypothetical protein JOS17DRAFT_494943 [Linnemannia elongata]|nr:MAG: hypothetical protein JOS17DRAFT_494943 [Linnemannia elongata]